MHESKTFTDVASQRRYVAYVQSVDVGAVIEEYRRFFGMTTPMKGGSTAGIPGVCIGAVLEEKVKNGSSLLSNFGVVPLRRLRRRQKQGV